MPADLTAAQRAGLEWAAGALLATHARARRDSVDGICGLAIAGFVAGYQAGLAAATRAAPDSPLSPRVPASAAAKSAPGVSPAPGADVAKPLGYDYGRALPVAAKPMADVQAWSLYTEHPFREGYAYAVALSDGTMLPAEVRFTQAGKRLQIFASMTRQQRKAHAQVWLLAGPAFRCEDRATARLSRFEPETGDHGDRLQPDDDGQVRGSSDADG